MTDPLDELPPKPSQAQVWPQPGIAAWKARADAAEAVARLYQREYYRLAEDVGEWNERHRIDAEAARIARGESDE